MQPANGEANTGLWFLAEPRDGRIEFRVIYDSSRFTESYMETLAREIVSTVDEVTADPSIRIRDLQLGRPVPNQKPAALAVELGTF